MAVARKRPTCPKCGEPAKAVHADRGKYFVGDTFIRWDRQHVCRLGVRYFIERMDNHQWYAGKSKWTNDAHKCLIWEKKENAEIFLIESTMISARIECKVTEHEFVHQELALLKYIVSGA